MMKATKGCLRRLGIECVDIAWSVGYGSESAFSNAFSRATGLSPGRFRKELGHRPAALACRRSGHNTFVKIIGKGSNHPMLASRPASILNHGQIKMGIPQIL
jgi:hypothetical protein